MQHLVAFKGYTKVLFTRSLLFRGTDVTRNRGTASSKLFLREEEQNLVQDFKKMGLLESEHITIASPAETGRSGLFLTSPASKGTVIARFHSNMIISKETANKSPIGSFLPWPQKGRELESHLQNRTCLSTFLLYEHERNKLYQNSTWKRWFKLIPQTYTNAIAIRQVPSLMKEVQGNNLLESQIELASANFEESYRLFMSKFNLAVPLQNKDSFIEGPSINLASLRKEQYAWAYNTITTRGYDSLQNPFCIPVMDFVRTPSSYDHQNVHLSKMKEGYYVLKATRDLEENSELLFPYSYGRNSSNSEVYSTHGFIPDLNSSYNLALHFPQKHVESKGVELLTKHGLQYSTDTEGNPFFAVTLTADDIESKVHLELLPIIRYLHANQSLINQVTNKYSNDFRIEDPVNDEHAEMNFAHAAIELLEAHMESYPTSIERDETTLKVLLKDKANLEHTNRLVDIIKLRLEEKKLIGLALRTLNEHMDLLRAQHAESHEHHRCDH